MREVAALAGVSLKTVSRVVNSEAGVSTGLRERVLAAVDRLDYRHDLTASSLRRIDGRSGTIGVILEDVANPFSSALQRAIEDVAREGEFLVLAASSDGDPGRERDLIWAFVSRRVDGLVIVPAGHDQSYLLPEQRSGTPVVFVDRPPGFLDADSVLTDNGPGVREGVRHLVAHGHRRIAYLGDQPTISTAADRHRGYVEELAASGIPVDDRLVRLGVGSIDSADAATADLLSTAAPPTALFTAQNLITVGALRALRRLSLHHRVALVGFDDFLLADLLEPAVSVVAQDPAAMGQASAGLLFRRLGGDRGPSEHIVVPTRMVVRGSGELLAG